MCVLGDRLEELKAAIQQTVEDSSWDLATEVVEFVLAILWSHVPNTPRRRSFWGSSHVRHLAADEVGTFVPEANGGHPAEGGDDPAVLPVDPEEESDAGQEGPFSCFCLSLGTAVPLSARLVMTSFEGDPFSISGSIASLDLFACWSKLSFCSLPARHASLTAPDDPKVSAVSSASRLLI